MTSDDTKAQENFAAKMTDILNHGALNLAMGIGYRLRLFDIMDEFDEPQTAGTLALKAGVNERYIIEWIGVMVSGGIIDLVKNDPAEDLFQLPKAHGDLLTRRADHNNLGVYTQEIPLLTTCAMEAVIEGFKTGDGVSYHHYPRFQQFMGQLADAKHRRVLVDIFLPSVDDGRIVEQLKTGIKVCDMGCAEGVALLLMARTFPNSEFTGFDIARDALETARSQAKKMGITNVAFLEKDVANLEDDDQFEGAFDYVTAFDAIHDQTQPLKALKGVYTVLKAGGAFSMVDIAAESSISENRMHPMGPFLYTVSLMHCMPVGLVEGGSGLGMMWGKKQAVTMLNQAGFHQVEVREIPEDSFNLHFFCRKIS